MLSDSPDAVALDADHRREPTAGPRPLRVLLIEDSIDDAILLERHLRRADFAPSILRIETAEAMRQELSAGERRHDIILADYNLPRFSAPEALHLLKTTAHDIPFIMMSGAVSEETAVAAMRAGAHDYVSKQNLARLAPAIERELAEAGSRRNRRAAERALELAEARFHRLVEAAPFPLLISDMRGAVVYANAAFERLLGFDQEEIRNQTLLLDHILPASRDDDGFRDVSAIKALITITRSLHSETVERLCLDKQGRPFPVLLGAAILNPEAEPNAQQVAAFLVDLSEQKRSEEVVRRTEKLAATGRLAASIAHEINNPLEAITNCLYLLSGCDLGSNERKYLHMAQQELDRVTQITTQTLRFYRQSTRASLTDLSELFATVINLYEPRLKSQSILIEREFAALPRLTTHEGELRQVLANLVGNALDAMTNGNEHATGRLLLRLHPTRDWQSGEPRVAIIVADTGGGMSPSTLRRLYEPFFSTKGITGTGLGLWVSHGIIAKHRGKIRVRSRQNAPSGTVFRITLPLNLPAGEDGLNKTT